MPHLSDARSAKSSFQLNTALNLVKQIATSTVAKDLKPGASVWEAVRGYISQLIAEIAKLLPLVMEPENVLKRTVTSYIYELQAYGVYRFWHGSMGDARRRDQSKHGGQRRSGT